MWHTQTIDEVKRNLNTNIYNGLTEKEVLKRKKKYGLNKLAEKKRIYSELLLVVLFLIAKTILKINVHLQLPGCINSGDLCSYENDRKQLYILFWSGHLHILIQDQSISPAN